MISKHLRRMAAIALASNLVVAMPCGYSAVRAATECDVSRFPPGWHDLPAVRDRRIFAVDANAYFSRPGPRLADGVALLAHQSV